MSNQNQKAKGYFLRQGQNATDRMSADIEILNISARLLINADKSAEIFKVLKNKKLGNKPIARGRFEKHPSAGVRNMPDIRGVVTTGKGTKVHFVGWQHDADFDPYYVIQIDQLVRAGQFVDFN